MAQRKRRRSSRTTRKQEFPGWLWMLFGLALGLSVAFAVYVKDRGPAENLALADRQIPVPQSMIDDNGETLADNTTTAATTNNRFDFYDMLPKFEVIIPEQEPDVTVDVAPQAVVEPGLYALQAGSFSTYADADRRRAELAMHGIESQIQRVAIDDKTYHRVRIGPTKDLDQLNMLRSRLHAAKIDVLRIRLGD
ncbi:MAG: SPOR domain-containing protein [Gammaproteobacteria bacterium]|nr:SPOR domain-containing protein [Gammaproteobacteria bacterium]